MNEISKLKLKNTEGALLFAENIIETVRDSLIVLNYELKVIYANKTFYEIFKVNPEETIGQYIYDLGNKQWDIPKLRSLLEEILPDKVCFDNYEVEHSFETIGRKVMLLNARRIDHVQLILLTIEDITERKCLQEVLKESEESYRKAFETSSDALLFVHKTEGAILNSNLSAQKLLGYSSDEFLKNKLWDIGIFKGFKEFHEAISRLEKDGVIHFEDMQVRNKEDLIIDTEVFLMDRAKVLQCNMRNLTERKKKDNELRKSESQYKTLVNNIPEKIFLKDINLVYLSCNQHYADDLGIKPEEIVGKTDYEFFPKEFAEKYRTDDKTIIESGKTMVFEEEYLKNGLKIFIHTIKTRVTDDQNNVIGVLGIFHDITERKKAEAIVKESEHLFRGMFENAGVGVALLVSATGQFIKVNRKYSDFTGYTIEEMEKLSFQDITHTEDIQLNREFIDSIIAGKSHEHTMEKRYIHKNGSVIWGRLTISPLCKIGKIPTHHIAIVEDITERKRIEAGLEKTRKELENIKLAEVGREYAECIINTIREPILALDKDLRVVKVNRSFYDFFKVTPEETKGQHIYELGNKQWDIPRLRKLLETIIPHNKTLENYEVEHEFPIIGKKIMLLNARQVEREMGKEKIILLAIEDITQKKHLEMVLIEAHNIALAASNAKSDFISNMSHEFRTPLNSILGFPQVLLDEEYGKLNEHQRDNVKDILISGEHLLSLVNNILKFRVSFYQK